MSNCNFCCNLGGEQAEIMCVLIMMGSDVCCVFGHCLYFSYYHVNVCFLLSGRKNEILDEKVVK